MNKLKLVFISALILFSFQHAKAQPNSPKIELTLYEAIAIAQGSSLTAFIKKNEYLSNYWDYRTYQAGFLPTLKLETSPFNYERAVREVYNSQDEEYQFIQNERLNSYANLSLTQNIPFTGGRIYIDSDLGRIYNIGGKIGYSSTPIRIGIRQSLFNFNSFKWAKIIEPIEFERAKRELLQSSQEIASRTVDYFFDLLETQIKLAIAQNDLAIADTLYRDGLSRSKVNAISLEDVYSLELSLMDANSDLGREETNVRRAQTRLLSFLRLDKSLEVELVPPDQIYLIDIEEILAIEMARKYNPDILDYERRRLTAERDVAREKKSRYSADLNISMGLNQTTDDNRIWNVYQDLDNQQRVQVSMNIPIIDWGLSKKRVNLAQSNKEVVMAQMEQNEIDFNENVKRTIEEFNQQKKIVKRAAMADTLAQMMYDVTQQRYMDGEADIIKLNLAQNKKNSARSYYFTELEDYWDLYYRVREITLYDFVRNSKISIDYSGVFQGDVLNTIKEQQFDMNFD